MVRASGPEPSRTGLGLKPVITGGTLEGADVHQGAGGVEAREAEAALVGSQAGGVGEADVARGDGDAAVQEAVGWRRPAVELERPRLGSRP